MKKIKNIIEALLFTSAHPIPLSEIFKTIEAEPSLVKMILMELQKEYHHRDSGLQIREVAGGYEMCTKPEYAPWIKKFHRIESKTRLSKPALETLAIIAYKQPITKVEIEALRGVNVDGVVETLLSKKLIKILGRKKAIGAPFLFGTTKEFLKYFGLKKLSELPAVKEIQKPPSPAIREERVTSSLPPNSTKKEKK